MAEPTSALTYYDLILKVAITAGLAYYGAAGNEGAMIPIDAHDLDLCKQIVNDGIKMFIANPPPNGWRWMRRTMSVVLAHAYTGTAEAGTTTSLTDSTIATTYDDDFFNTYVLKITDGTGKDETATVTDYDGTLGKFTFTGGLSGDSTPDTTSKYSIIRSTDVIDEDAARYLLAENFGGEVNGEISYAANTNHGSVIDWCDESVIRAKRAISVSTGYPTLAAIRPYQPTGSALMATRQWELIVDPQPSAVDTIEFPYTLFFNKLRLEAGLATNGAAAAVSDSSLANIYPDDSFKDWKITIISGTGKGATAIITSYVGADGEFFVDDWLYSDDTAAAVNPASGSAYYLEPTTNLHPAGFRFDEVIVAACLAKAEQLIEDVTTGFYQIYMQKELPMAYRADTRSASKNMGPMSDGKKTYRDRYRRNVTTDWDS